MELPSFVTNALNALRRRFLKSPTSQSLELYHFALRNPIACPPSGMASRLANRPIDNNGLYALNLPDDELTQYRMIALHIWILQKVLLTSHDADLQRRFINFEPLTGSKGYAPTPRHQKIMYYLFEHFWSDLTPFLKDARGEIRLTKTIKSVQEYFYGAFLTLDLAWTPVQPVEGEEIVDENTQREFLAAAVWRNYWMADHEASKRDVYRLIYYIQSQLDHLSKIPKDQLWHGEGLTEWKSMKSIMDPVTGCASDEVLSKRLRCNPASWQNSNFSLWEEQTLQGQTFDNRKQS